MAKNGEIENTALDNDKGGDEGESGQKLLYNFIFNPTKERMPELTDLPLSQITPLTWMATYDAVFEEVVEYVKYAVDLRKYKNALNNGDNGAKAPEPPIPVLPSRVYREWYYKHRRSLTGAGVKTAAVLAERQLEVQQELQSPDQLAGLPKD